MGATTEAQCILRALQAGDDQQAEQLFWEVVERYRGVLINQAFAITGSLSDAEDAAQETFCKAFQQRGRLAEVRSLGAWLRSINRGFALNRRRGKAAAQSHAQRSAESARRLATSGGFTALELRELVARSVEGLPEKMRQVLLLRYMEDLPYEQIAQRLGLSVGTVGWLLCEATVKLHGKLNRHFQGDARSLVPEGALSRRQGEAGSSPEVRA